MNTTPMTAEMAEFFNSARERFQAEKFAALEAALIAECERAMQQRDEFKRTGVSTAGHGGSHDTIFGFILRQHGVKF